MCVYLEWLYTRPRAVAQLLVSLVNKMAKIRTFLLKRLKLTVKLSGRLQTNTDKRLIKITLFDEHKFASSNRTLSVFCDKFVCWLVLGLLSPEQRSWWTIRTSSVWNDVPSCTATDPRSRRLLRRTAELWSTAEHIRPPRHARFRRPTHRRSSTEALP